MSYDPNDQKITFSQILAGWTLCLALAGAAFATTGDHRATSSANASGPAFSVEASRSLRGAPLLSFASCAVTQGGTASPTHRHMPLPTSPCS